MKWWYSLAEYDQRAFDTLACFSNDGRDQLTNHLPGVDSFFAFRAVVVD